MENNEKLLNNPNLISKGQLIDHKKYELHLEEDFYTLLIELYNNVLSFKLNSHNLSLNYYTKEYTYEDILNLLSLEKANYEDLKKIFIFFDKAIEDKKVNLSENKDKKMMILEVKRVSDNKEFKCNLELNEAKIPNEEVIKLLIEEIYLLRKDKKESKEIINNLIEKNKQNEEDIKYLEDQIKKYEKLENSIIKKVDAKIENIKIQNLNQQNNLKNHPSIPLSNEPLLGMGMPNPMPNFGMGIGMMNNMNMNQMMNNMMMPNQKKEIVINIFLEDNINRIRISLLCSPTEKIEDIRSRYFSKICKKDEREIFIFNAQNLEKGKTIADYGIENGSKILVVNTKNELIG